MMTSVQRNIFIVAGLVFPASALALDQVTFSSIAQGNDLAGAITTLVGALAGFASVIAVIFIIYGGIKYVMSAGDEKAADTGKRAVIYGILGLVIVGLAAAIVNFVVAAIK